jgi:hypothetical protein
MTHSTGCDESSEPQRQGHGQEGASSPGLSVAHRRVTRDSALGVYTLIPGDRLTCDGGAVS